VLRRPSMPNTVRSAKRALKWCVRGAVCTIMVHHCGSWDS